MELSSSSIKKFLIFSYISRNKTSKRFSENFFYIPRNETSLPQKNLINFFKVSGPKKVDKTPLGETGCLRNH